MARVQRAEIEKARKMIDDLMASLAFPSRDELLESNRKLFNVVTLVRGRDRNIPEKTICGLLVDALNLGNDVTREAIWKRYKRMTADSVGSGTNRDTGANQVIPRNIIDNSNRVGPGVNRDTSKELFIPQDITQTDLAAGIAQFFKSQGYDCASLLRTCLMAMDEMAFTMEVSEIKDTIDARYQAQGDDGDSEETEP